MEKGPIREMVIRLLQNEEVFEGINIKEDIMDDEDLETYGMDSLSFVQMIVKLENEFQKEIPNELLSYDNLSSITKIVENLYEILK